MDSGGCIVHPAQGAIHPEWQLCGDGGEDLGTGCRSLGEVGDHGVDAAERIDCDESGTDQTQLEGWGLAGSVQQVTPTATYC